VLYCVPIPGESSWTQSKQTLERISTAKNANTSKKRDRVEDDEDMDENLDLLEENVQQSKRRNVQERSFAPSVVTETTQLNSRSALELPLPSDVGTPAAVKIYENTSFKICEILEIVGVISEDITSFSSEYEPKEYPISFYLTKYQSEMMMSAQIDNIPSSLVPRLHCISYKRFNSVQDPYVDEKRK
jgi:hypothetical protein